MLPKQDFDQVINYSSLSKTVNYQHLVFYFLQNYMVYCLQRTTNRYFSKQHLKGVEQFQSKGPRGGSES